MAQAQSAPDRERPLDFLPKLLSDPTLGCMFVPPYRTKGAAWSSLAQSRTAGLSRLRRLSPPDAEVSRTREGWDMTGRYLAAAGLVLATALAAAWSSWTPAEATTFNPFFGPPDFYRLDPTTPGSRP